MQMKSPCSVQKYQALGWELFTSTLPLTFFHCVSVSGHTMSTWLRTYNLLSEAQFWSDWETCREMPVMLPSVRIAKEENVNRTQERRNARDTVRSSHFTFP